MNLCDSCCSDDMRYVVFSDAARGNEGDAIGRHGNQPGNRRNSLFCVGGPTRCQDAIHTSLDKNLKCAIEIKGQVKGAMKRVFSGRAISTTVRVLSLSISPFLSGCRRPHHPHQVA